MNTGPITSEWQGLMDAQRALIQTLMDENARLRSELAAHLASRDAAMLEGSQPDVMTGTLSPALLQELAELKGAVRSRRDLRSETLSGGMES